MNKKDCFNCLHYADFGRSGICLIAKTWIEDIKVLNFVKCDYWRPDICDRIHDNDAMERCIKENDQDVSGKE